MSFMLFHIDKKNPKRGEFVISYYWFNKNKNLPLVFVTGP